MKARKLQLNLSFTAFHKTVASCHPWPAVLVVLLFSSPSSWCHWEGRSREGGAAIGRKWLEGRGGWKGKRKTVEERQFNNNKWLNAKWCLNTQRVLAGCYLFLLFSIETWMDFFSTSVCASMCVCLCVGIKYYFSIFKIVVLPLKVFFK